MNEIKNNKMENSYLGRSWYFVTFSVADYPTPLFWKIQISNIFPKSKFEVADYPPPLGNSYLGRLWYFVIFQLQITPPPISLENPNFQLFP